MIVIPVPEIRSTPASQHRVNQALWRPFQANQALPGEPDHDAIDGNSSVLKLIEAHHQARQGRVGHCDVAVAPIPRNVGLEAGGAVFAGRQSVRSCR